MAWPSCIRMALSHVELAIIGMYNEVIKGNVRAFSVLADRTEGKAMQVVHMSGPRGGALQIDHSDPVAHQAATPSPT